MADLGKHKPSRLPPCWGIGLARTGTTSFCEALKLLGYKRVVHNPRFERLPRLQGGSDNGVTIHYKYLDYKFPGSKFVLTTRPFEEWIKSIKFIVDTYPAHADDDHAILRRMTLYESVSFDLEKYTAAYHRHHDDVRRYFRNRKNDLLEMTISNGDGWQLLCPFLGVPVPDVQFPVANTRQDVMRRK